MTISVRWERSAHAPAGSTRRALGSLVRRAVRRTLTDVDGIDATAAEVSVALVGDATIARLNGRWLGHDGTTDVLSFPLFQAGEPPVGDVYIGVDHAIRQAAVYGVDPVEEIVRLAIHGTLHVLGWDHPAGAARLRSPMWHAQERLVDEVLAS